MRDQPGVGVVDDDEGKRKKPGGGDGNARRISQSCDRRNQRSAQNFGRPSRDEERAKFSAAGQVRDACMARSRAGIGARRRRSDGFDRTNLIARRRGNYSTSCNAMLAPTHDLSMMTSTPII